MEADIRKVIAEIEAEIESRKLESPNLSGDYHAENRGHIHALNATVIKLRAIVLSADLSMTDADFEDVAMSVDNISLDD